MRWNKAELYDEKVVRKFLWLPATVTVDPPYGSGGETRWLERATVRYRLMSVVGWVPVEFVDDPAESHPENPMDKVM